MTIHWQNILHDDHKSVRQMIINHHYLENMTIEMMAEHFGVSEWALKKQIRKLGIIMKSRYGKRYSRNPRLRFMNWRSG